MVKVQQRKEEILQYIEEYMEEYFQKSCREIEMELEKRGNELWMELKKCICECLRKTEILQKQQRKSNIQYLVFSFLRCGVLQDRLEIRIDALDDSFYLDEEEAESYFYPTFLQGKYVNDLELIHQTAKKKFVRLQKYEYEYMKKEYASFYFSILYQIIKELSVLIAGTVLASGVLVGDDFKIIMGEYMNHAVVLYVTKESVK